MSLERIQGCALLCVGLEVPLSVPLQRCGLKVVGQRGASAGPGHNTEGYNQHVVPDVR
jgi:hypothetical protein